MKKKILFGLMAMLLPLATWAQGQFDVSGVEDTYVYDGVRTLEPTVVAYSQELTPKTHYTISYTLNGEPTDVVQNVGNYVMTIAGAANTLYENLTPTTVAFEITKKEVTSLTFTKTKVSRDYDGTDDDSSVLPKLVLGATGLATTGVTEAEELENFLKCLKVVRQSGEEGADANTNGKYHVSVQGKAKTENTGSNYYLKEQEVGNWVQMDINPLTLTATLDFDRQYNGKEVTPANLNSRVKFDNVIDDDKDYVKASLSKGKSEGNWTDVGTYTLNVALAGTKAKNYVLTTKTIDIKITKIPLVITLNETDKDNLTRAYDADMAGDKAANEEVTNYFTIKANPTDEKNTIFDTEKTDLALALFAEVKDGNHNGAAYEKYAIGLYQNKGTTDKENYVKVVEGTETALTNYSFTLPEDVYYAITGKKLEDNAVTISEDKELLAYQGKEFEIPAGLVTVKDGGNTLGADDYDLIVETVNTVLDNEKATNAGDEFKVVVTGKGNYAGTKITTTDALMIHKLILEITPKEGEVIGKTYGDEDPTPEMLMSKYDFKGWVKIDGEEKENAETIGLTMKRAKDSNTNYEEVNDKGYAVRLYDAKKDGEDGWIKKDKYETYFTNYKIVYDVEAKEYDTRFYITPKTLNYYISAAEYTYSYKPDTQTFTVESDDLVGGDKIPDIFTNAPIVALKLKEGENSRNKGVYDLEVTNADEVTAKNYKPVYSPSERDGKYTVKPAELTITALAQKIEYLSEEKPNLKLDENHTKVNNNGKEGDNIWFDGIQFEAEWKSMIQKLGELVLDVEEGFDVTQKVGKHTITFAEEAMADVKATYTNYNITFDNGYLTVVGVSELTFDRNIDEETDPTNAISTLVKAYDGQEVTKVTLKTTEGAAAWTYKANEWYTLVLPFNVTPRQVSKAFGYAVVDVPNENSTNDAVFSLTVSGTIKANTLMLIKIDEARDLSKEGEEIVFEADEDAPFVINVATTHEDEIYGEDYYVNDQADNYFHGVYKTTDLGNKKGYWYMGSKDGHNTIVDAGNRPEGAVTNVRPLAGYIVMPTNASSRSIIVEEPDGSTTAINAVIVDTLNAAEGWYTVGGMKLEGEPTQKGVYINNGKKVVIK